MAEGTFHIFYLLGLIFLHCGETARVTNDPAISLRFGTQTATWNFTPFLHAVCMSLLAGSHFVSQFYKSAYAARFVHSPFVTQSSALTFPNWHCMPEVSSSPAISCCLKTDDPLMIMHLAPCSSSLSFSELLIFVTLVRHWPIYRLCLWPLTTR